MVRKEAAREFLPELQALNRDGLNRRTLLSSGEEVVDKFKNGGGWSGIDIAENLKNRYYLELLLRKGGNYAISDNLHQHRRAINN